VTENEDSTADGSTETQPEPGPEAAAVDVDLTTLSSTMIYAEVYNMMAAPEQYIGKTVKMRGQYTSSYYEETQQYYHFVVIADAAACCQQGMEFVWNGDHAYPGDYPADGTVIEVAGVFGSYEELGETYYHLTVDEITVCNGP